jgi:oxidoreductase
VTPAEELSAHARGKLDQKVIDFERLDEAGLRDGNWDVVFIALGTTINLAGSQENFTKIDKEYVVNAAKAAKVDKDQRLVYISVVGANPESGGFYVRSKGSTEQALAELGYKDTIFFRPAMLANVKRPEGRLGESIILGVTGALSWISSSLQIEVDKLAKSALIAGELGTSKLPSGAAATQTKWGGRSFTAIGNKGALFLSR